MEDNRENMDRRDPKVKHYNQHPSGVECITIIQHFNLNVGNVIKYAWRAGLKKGNSSIEDLQKAIDYANYEIKRIEEFENGKPNISIR